MSDRRRLLEANQGVNYEISGYSYKYNQLIPDGIASLESNVGTVPGISMVGSYITKWLDIENRVGNKVYAKITTSDPKIRLCWYVNNKQGYDFVTGEFLGADTETPPTTYEGIYEITQDMVWSDGYAQLYYFVFEGCPVGKKNLTLQLVDLTALGLNDLDAPLKSIKLPFTRQNKIMSATGPFKSVDSKGNEKSFGDGIELIGINGKGHNLPNDYQEVEYLESTGTQYIDLGVKGNQNSRVIIDYLVTGSYVSGYRLFGSRVNSRNSEFFISSNSSTTLYVGYGAHAIIYTYNPYKRYLIDFNKNKVYLNNQQLQNINYNTFTTPTNLFLFGGYSQGGIINTYGFKIYRCKYYDNDIIIRSFIPCYRKSDKKPGMFDMVSGQFFTNQGTGEFVLGSEVIVNTYSTKGKIEEKVGSVDLGEPKWNYITTWENKAFRTGTTQGFPQDAKIGFDFISAKYKKIPTSKNWSSIASSNLNIGTIDSAIGLVIRDDDYDNAQTFQQSLVGTPLNYELANPSTKSAPKAKLPKGIAHIYDANGIELNFIERK